MEYVFAYGSNMSSERLASRNITGFETVGVGILKHWQLKFNKISYANKQVGFANIVPCWNNVMYGVIYKINDEQIVMIDKAEGYPKHYEKIMLPVFAIKQDDILDCVTYVANNLWVSNKKLLVTGQYAQHIQTGLKEHFTTDGVQEYKNGLNEKILDHVLL